MTGADDAPRGLQNGRFLIENVKIYNASGKGYVAPDYANFDPAGGEEGKGIVTVPTIPSDASSVILSYNHNVEIIPYGFHREIYLAETEASAGHTILIGAYYIPPGESLATVDKTWYRVNLYEPLEYDDDFEIDPEKPDEKPPLPERTLWDILRNYRYRVNIVHVDRAGYNSEEEAYENDPANLLTDISVYDESGGINYIIYDDNYMLGLEKNNYIFTLDEHTNVSFPILTNYESGWSYEITDSAGEDGNPVSWITNDSRTTNPAGIKDYLTITIEAGVISRRAYIHVQAGILQEVITIIQQ
ncbi:MAG: hypothetical protein LUE98_19340 [Tannerellaceae bacterium]|nr:hypothetical protein [Tannerellaceae bacterium]